MTESNAVRRTIAAPADVVWSLVSDVTRMGEWSPETTACDWKGGASGPAVGAKFAGKNRNGKKSWSTACTVKDCEPGRSFSFLVSAVGLSVAEWGYRIEPTPEGCVVEEYWVDRRNGLVKALGKPLSGVEDRDSHNRAGMETTLANLAAVAEAQA